MLGIFPAFHRKPGALCKANVHRHNHNKAAFPCAVMGNEFSAYSISAGYCLERSWIFLFLHRVNNFFPNIGTLHFTDVDLLRERDGLGTSAPSSSTGVLALLHFPAQRYSAPNFQTEISGLQQVVCACTGIAIPWSNSSIQYGSRGSFPFTAASLLNLMSKPGLVSIAKSLEKYFREFSFLASVYVLWPLQHQIRNTLKFWEL